MKNVSNEFRKTMNTRTDFYMESDVVFADGTEKELTRENFYLSGNSYTDAAGSSSFPLGVALEKQIQISLVNDKDQFSEYDFYGAKFTVYCCLDLDSGTTEKILFGTFTVTEPETYGSVITVTAVDDMYKGDKDYSTGLTFPMTAGQALRDSCSACGVTLLDTTFTNDDYIISEMPEGITHRALWGLCAMLAGGNARMDEYNRLRIVSYDFSLFDRAGLNGGVFDADTPYSSGDTADGGSFNPWDAGAVVDGGTFIEAKDYHVFWKAKNLTVATDDVVITGIQTTVDDETYRFGEEGYILSLTNQLIEGNPQDAVNRIGALIVGARFRPFSMDHTAYPLAEVGDVCFVVDRKQNTYQAIVTDVNFTFFGFTTLQCQADSPIRNSSKYNSQLTQAIVQARLNTQKQITEYDKAVQQLTSLITQSFGVYKTEEVLEDGSTIYYMHNKPTLAESQTIWKMTADAFAVSTDGGKTWNAGMDAEGNVVLNVLSAIGINAEWINVKDLSAFNATIGGWGISSGQISKYVDLYDDMTAEGLADVASTDPVRYYVWMRSPQDENTPVFGIYYMRKQEFLNNVDAAYPIFSARTDGSVTADSFRSKSANITGGEIKIKNDKENHSIITLTARGTDGYDYWTDLSGYSIAASKGSYTEQVESPVNSASLGSEYITLYLNDISGWAFYVGGDAREMLVGLDAFFYQRLICSGTKSRKINTKHFGEVLQYCYETPSPLFGDIGSGKTDEAGISYVYFDPVFSETISSDMEYYVFLQKEGEGDIWVDEKTEEYFSVKGTPELRFSWEVKVRQKEYEYNRLDVLDRSKDESEIDYSSDADTYLNDYEKEILNYEEIN